MIYIVTGHARSGTSMIVNALDAGGLSGVRSSRSDKQGEKFSDEQYKVNPNGLWEPDPNELKNPQFPRMHEGQVVKLVFGIMHFMRPHWYAVDIEKYSAPLYRPGYRAFVPGQPYIQNKYPTQASHL